MGGEIQTRIFMGKELTFRTKWGIWKAEIGSVLSYSLATTKQTNAMETKLQVCVSNCLRSIVDEEEDGGKGTIERESQKKQKQKEKDDEKGKRRSDRSKKKKKFRVQNGHKNADDNVIYRKDEAP